MAGCRLRRSMPFPPRALERRCTRLIGADTVVPCIDGRTRRYVNLDYAASTPVMPAVWDAVDAFAPVVQQRASRQRSEVAALHRPRSRTRETRSPSSSAPGPATPSSSSGTRPRLSRPVGGPARGHAGTFERGRASLQHASVAAPRSPAAPVHRLAGRAVGGGERALRRARPRIDLVAITGASNVSGEVWPVADLAELAHLHGAQLFVDAAQLAPHRRLDMAGAGIDFLALSGHKLYAPFGAGVLVGDACGRARGSRC